MGQGIFLKQHSNLKIFLNSIITINFFPIYSFVPIRQLHIIIFELNSLKNNFNK